MAFSDKLKSSDLPDVKPWYHRWSLQWVVLLVLFALATLLWLSQTAPWEDSLLLSQASVLQALGYQQGGSFTTPQHLIPMPPLYPLILAGLAQFSHHAWPHILPVWVSVQWGLWLLAIVLVFVYARKRLRPSLALLITALTVVSPVVNHGVAVLSPQLLYTCLSLLAIIAVDSVLSNTPDDIEVGELFHCGVWLTAALLCDSLGVALVLAFVVLAWQRIGIKPTVQCLLWMAVVLSPWLLWSWSRPVMVGTAHSWLQWLQHHPPHSWLQGLYLLDTNLTAWTDDLLGTWPLPWTTHGQLQWAEWAPIRWGLGGITLVGLVAGLTHYTGVGSLYVMLAALLTLVTPLGDGWNTLPLWPLWLFFLITGVHWLQKGLAALYLKPVGQWFLNGLLMVMVIHSILFRLQSPTTVVAHSPGLAGPVALLRSLAQPNGFYPTPAVQHQQAMMEWIGRQTLPTDRFLASDPDLVRRLTGRLAWPFVPTTRWWQSRSALKHVDYVLIHTTEANRSTVSAWLAAWTQKEALGKSSASSQAYLAYESGPWQLWRF